MLEGAKFNRKINQNNKIMTKLIDEVAERNEILQPIIDRLLYLPEDKKSEFTHYLNTLMSIYHIEVDVVNGIRIYHINKEKI